MSTMVHQTAQIDDNVQLGEGTRIWANAQIRANAMLGRNCIVGKDAYIGSGVILGDNCKVQNGALVYEPATLGDGVFIGPGAILTNDQFPRAITPEGKLKRNSDWTPVGVRVHQGASIGAGAVCVAPIEIGAWAAVAAGAVVTRDVPSFALVAGVPARWIGWVGKSGFKLVEDEGRFKCPRTSQAYELVEGILVEARTI